MIGYYKSKVKFEKSMTNQANRQLKMLRDNVKEISKCNTCHGNQHKTTGGTPCEECGLIGMKPWGG
jgi:hypothetical protein